MKCDVCPHMAAIKAALKPCQTCEAGRLNHTCHYDGDKLEYAIAAHAITNAPSVKVTALPDDVEHTLRMFMSDLFALDPLNFLLVQHLMNRKPQNSFGDALFALANKINSYRGSFRAMASAKKRSVSRDMPTLAAVLDALARQNRVKSPPRRIPRRDKPTAHRAR